MSLNTSSAVTKLRSLTQRFDHAVVAANPFYPTLCTDVPSDGADEEYGMLGAVPGVREWLGDRSYKELREANWTIRNKLWEQSLQILPGLLRDLASTQQPADLAKERAARFGKAVSNLA